MIRFCDHHNIEHIRMTRTNVFTDVQRHHFEITLRAFRHEWRDRFTNEQHLERSFIQWVLTLLNHIKSIDLFATFDGCNYNVCLIIVIKSIL